MARDAFDLIEGDFVRKERCIWDPRALQLLREKATAQYALEVVPRLVNGIRIVFPEIVVFFGLRVSVRSRRIKGRSLLEMIYDQESQEFALNMAMIALEALDRARVTSSRFVLFGMAYRSIRRLKVTLGERLGASILSPEQQVEMNRLVSNYVKERRGERRVLVHGDLHASNLIVNWEERSLGFVDLEMIHIGKSITNFAQLWISFHFADPLLGYKFYQQYAKQSLEAMSERFDPDVRAEIALRCYSLVREARRTGHAELEEKARTLLRSVLSSDFDRVCFAPE